MCFPDRICSATPTAATPTTPAPSEEEDSSSSVATEVVASPTELSETPEEGRKRPREEPSAEGDETEKRRKGRSSEGTEAE